MLMLMGYAIIAVPTGIVTTEIAQAERDKKESEAAAKRACSSCGMRGHDDDAVFCKNCSAKL